MRALIGIPTLNGPDRLERLLFSLRHYTNPELLNECTILVADDGSTEAHLEKNKTICAKFGVELLYGHGRTGIARTWNRLIRHTKTASVILVNDDIQVIPDWLQVLLYSVEQNSHVGMVSLSCRTGGLSEEFYDPRAQLDYNEAKLLSGNNCLISSQGTCFAFRRELWDLVGGFDERYFCFYEEVDFGVALGKQNYFHYVASYPNPFHMGGATTSNTDNLNAGEIIAESKEKFHAKWQMSLSEIRDSFANRQPPPQPKEWNSQIKNWK